MVLESASAVRESDFTDQGWRLLQSTNTVEAVRKRFDSADYFALLCEIESTVVGYIAMVGFEKIDHMFVLEQHRRKGISKQLWKRAQQICASSGNENYYWVRSSSYAEPVYASFGFRPSGERLVSKGISFRLMEKGEKKLI